MSNVNWVESADHSDNSATVPSEDDVDQSDFAGTYKKPRHVIRSRLRKQARESREQQERQQQQPTTEPSSATTNEAATAS